MTTRAKYLEDAALVIDGRVADLKAELARDEARDPQPTTLSSDRAAIMEAQCCANMIRALKKARRYKDPYEESLIQTGWKSRV